MNHSSVIIKTWRIASCGWDAYFKEVAALSRGRIDVRIACGQGGVLSLIEKDSVNDDQYPLGGYRPRDNGKG